jgi:hypothetical protein
MANLGGRHRQRDTGRLLTYWAAFDVTDSTATYCAVLHDRDRYLASPDGQVHFDQADMTGEEAVRQDIGRYIDTHPFGEGTAPEPSWTDLGAWK